jgi:Clp amino terminal domain, pathogenicity island component
VPHLGYAPLPRHPKLWNVRSERGKRMPNSVSKCPTSVAPLERIAQDPVSAMSNLPGNFDARARQVVQRAQAAAVAFGHGYVGTEHLLLGLLDDDGRAGKALAGVGVKPERAREMVRKGLRQNPPHTREPGWTDDLDTAIAIAQAQAARLGHATVTPEHLLLGLVDGLGVRFLRSLELDVDRLWRETQAALGIQEHQRIARTSRAYEGEPPHDRLAPETLRRVVPIAQTLADQGYYLTVLSLEDYTDGFLVRAILRTEHQPDGIAAPPGSHIRIPKFGMTASDDRGAYYVHQLRALSGTDRKWDFQWAFTPALRMQARLLKLDINELRWEPFDLWTGASDAQTLLPVGWSFEIKLAGRNHTHVSRTVA